MEIKLRGLGQGEHKFTFDEPAADYRLDAEQFFLNVSSDVQVDVQGRNYYIHIYSVTRARLTCDRCAEEFVRNHETITEVIYTENPALDPEHTQTDLFFLPAERDSVVLNEDVRQNILLEIPMKVLCRETCKGLCLTCGANLNQGDCSCATAAADPRWEALKNLL